MALTHYILSANRKCVTIRTFRYSMKYCLSWC